MSRPDRVRLTLVAIVAVIAMSGGKGYAQADVAPVNDLPNPYRTIAHWGMLPDGRTWGSTATADLDPDGKSIWVGERCGANSCAGSTVAPVLKFDPSGKLLKSFGTGMLIFPHGMYVDKDGNVWVTDQRGPTPQELEKFPGTKALGHTVTKFSPDGKVLLTLGKGGVAGDPPDALNEPCDVVIAPNGDIIVAEGHSGQSEKIPPGTVGRISKFTKDGKFIKSWGKLGSGPGEFRTPHALAIDSRGRLFVGDRGNMRIQIMDLDGKYMTEWKQFSRPSGIFIDKKDTIYVADSESNGVAPHPGWKRGIRIGSAKDGKVMSFVPDPDEMKGTSAAEGVVADTQGNIYGAEVGPKGMKKYVKQ